jgi:dTDP-4-dehydrorhamnose reductase
MKILITGASGLLGRAVYNLFTQSGLDCVGTSFSRNQPHLIKLDLTNESTLEHALNSHSPDFIIHTAAERRPDECENNASGVYNLNVKATASLAEWSEVNQKPLLFISTDYVFDGKKAPYSIDDEPTPINAYGESKARAEVILLEKSSTAKILRIPVLYGKVEYMRESALSLIFHQLYHAQGEVELDHWSKRYPTAVEDVAEVVLQMQRKWHMLTESIYHWSSSQCWTKYEIAKLLQEAFHLHEKKILPQEQNPTDAPRPYDCHLDRRELKKIGIHAERDFKGWFLECVSEAAKATDYTVHK